MNGIELVKNLWGDMELQNWNNLSRYFFQDAIIKWPNTNEVFTVDNFIKANSEYPGKWSIEIKRLETIGNLVISVVLVYLESSAVSFYATSFFEFEAEKIKTLVEYWGENSAPPEWRQLMNLSGIPRCFTD